MKRRQREAIVAELDNRLDARGSWCGETHLQKSVYFLQTLLGVPLDFEFILYKYGPFSSDLRAELGVMRADGFLTLVPQPAPYGPSLKISPTAEEQLVERWPKTIGRYNREIDFVAEKLGGLGVSELERLATALWVINDMPDADDRARADRLHRLKPHVSRDQALDAIQRVHRLEGEAEAILA